MITSSEIILSSYFLYHTLGCHLCEDAEKILQLLPDIDYQKKDIADDDALVERFGVRIPVLCHIQSQSTIDWPFDVAAIQAYLGRVQEG